MSALIARRSLLAIGAAILIAAGGWLLLRRSPADSNPTALVSRGRLDQTIETTGVLEPVNAVTISGRVGGLLRLVAVRAGDRVVAGDIVAEIDPEPFEAEVAVVRRQVEAAELSLTAAELDLIDGDVQSALAVVEAAQRIEAARAALAAAERDLTATVVLAPVGGTVLAVAAGEGQAYPAGSPIAIVGEGDRLQVRAELDEIDVVRLSLGAAAEVVADARPAAPQTGEVAAIAPRGENTGGVTLFPVTIALAGPLDPALRPGMSVTVRLPVADGGELLLVPAEAITTVGRRSFVDVVADGQIVRREVTTGARAAGLVEITSGELRAGERVRLTDE
jgi:RND family efflux transporter MFP subunit